MKVLVTGGAGFIGRHLVDRLTSLEYEVDVLDNFSRSSRLEKNEKASYIELDIRDDLLISFWFNKTFREDRATLFLSRIVGHE